MKFRPLSRTAVSIAWLLAAAAPALCLDGRWELLGPYGARISSLAAAPSNARVLYAGTYDGKIFRSGNAGASWLEVTGGFPLGRPIDDIEVDPRNPAKAFAIACDPEYFDHPAVGGLFKTVNGGQSWDLVESLGQCQVNDVAIDPRTPSKILAATVFGLYQSTNGGTTWRQQAGPPRLTDVTRVAFDPSTSGAVYAVDHELGFLRSVNGGSNWTVRNAGLPPAGERQITGMTVSPGGPKTLFLHLLNLHIAPLYRSLDGGLTWAPAARGLGERWVSDMAAAAAPPRFYAATHEGLFVSANQGRSWQAMATPLGDVKRLLLPVNSGAFYAADGLGLLKSANLGATWVDANRGLLPLWTYNVLVAPANENVLYADMGLRSLDGGANWARSGGTVLAVDPTQPRVVFGAGDQSLWKSRDAGATWVRLAALPCLSPKFLAVDPATPSNLYAIADPILGCASIPPCGNLRSVDAGVTWSCMADLPEHVTTLRIAPSEPSTLYAVGGYPQTQIFKTTNGGVSWQGVHDVSGVFVAGLAVSPEDPDQLWVTLSYNPFRSTDGGVTWSPTPGLPGEAIVVPAPSDASVLYAVAQPANERILLRSGDAGTTWNPVSQQGLPTGPFTLIQGLSVSPTDPETLFAATQSGLYRLRGE